MYDASVILNPWLYRMCVWCGWNFVPDGRTKKAILGVWCIYSCSWCTWPWCTYIWCMMRAFIHDPDTACIFGLRSLTLIHVCVMHTSIIRDPDTCVYDACIHDAAYLSCMSKPWLWCIYTLCMYVLCIYICSLIMYARCIYICSLIMMHMCMMHTSVIFNPWLCCMCVWCGWNFVTNKAILGVGCSMPIRMKHVSMMHACVMHVKNGDRRTNKQTNGRKAEF